MESLKEKIVLIAGESEKIRQLKIEYILSDDIIEKKHLKFVIWQLSNNL